MCISVEKRCIILWMYPRHYGEAVHRLLVSGFSPWRRGFDPRPAYAGFTIDKVLLGQVFLGVLRISPVIIIPPLLHSHFPCKVKIKVKVIFIITNKCTINITGIYHNTVSLHNSHFYMFRHFHVIIREFHICALLSYINC